MRTKTLEIRWHDTQPIFSADAQPYPPHQLRRLLGQHQQHLQPGTPAAAAAVAAGKDKEKEVSAAGRSYRVATGGADNHVRLWLIHPNIPDVPSTSAGASLQVPQAPSAPPPRAEFLATLRRHTAAVNVVRWSPKEDVLASAGDDGYVLLWVPKTGPDGVAGPSSGGFADSAATEEGQKEFWKVRTFIRVTQNEIYDLAWSPDGSHFIVGCTDNVAKIYDASTGTCIKAIAEHTHYVQGVAWDPLNEFVATQSSDRSVHIYKIHQSKGELDFIPHGRSEKLNVHGSRHPSFGSASGGGGGSRPNFARRDSTAMSDTESVLTSAASDHGPDESIATGSTGGPPGPLTPSASLPGTPSLASAPVAPTSASASMAPPSRRSSMSSSVAASPPPPPASRFNRSPSPLPAVRPNNQPPTAPSRPPATTAVSSRLYGDESYTHYFRRLAFSPDGALLLTPAGQIESSLLAPSGVTPAVADNDAAPSTALGTGSKDGKPKRPPAAQAEGARPTVYIYSRANLTNGPVAHLPGQKTASVAVRFNPILYDLREVKGSHGGVHPHAQHKPKTIVVDEKSGEEVKVKMFDAAETAGVVKDDPSGASSAPASSSLSTSIGGQLPPPSPTLAPAQQQPSTFSLPYRMYFAVATQDAVLLYDTQQPSPIAIFVGLHYAGFTDLTWSPDGQTLLLCSIDGYCTVVVFDPSELGTLHHTQQHQKQLQALAHNLSSAASHGAAAAASLPPSPGPGVATPVPAPAETGGGVKRALEHPGKEDAGRESEIAVVASTVAGSAAPAAVTAAAPTVAVEAAPSAGASAAPAPIAASAGEADSGGAKKKRRVELKHLGPLE